MEYSSEKEFIIRSYKNLQRYLILHEGDPAQYPYENTQTINSLLGILAFPYQTIPDIFQRIDITNLTERMFCVEEKTPENFFKHLRNAVCHFRLTTKANKHTKEITSIIFSDRGNYGKGKKNFEIELKVKEMQALIDDIYNAVITDENTK